MLSIANAWSPSSWKSLPIKQSPDWPVNQLNDPFIIERKKRKEYLKAAEKWEGIVKELSKRK